MKLFLAITVSVILALAGVAEAKPYTVVSGDTLSVIAANHNVSVDSIVKISHRIKNPNHIEVGWVIEIPECLKSVKVEILTNSYKKEVVKNKTSRKKLKVGPWNPGSNPWKLGKIEGVKRSPFLSSEAKVGLIEEIKAGRRFGVTINHNGIVSGEKGIKYEMLAMGYGKGGFFKPVPAWKDKGKEEPAWAYAFNGEFIAFPWKCDNPTPLGLIPPEEPVSPKEPEKPLFSIPVIEPFVPFEPFMPWAPEKPPQCRDFELSLGTGLLFGSEASMKDLWYYGEGMYWDSCWGWSRGIGFYFNGDFGDVDAPYEWDNFGIGPQVGLRYQGIIKDKSGVVHPFGWTAKLRLIWATATGKNPDSGYEMTQEDLLLGLYTEYLRQIERGLIAGITFEGWLSLYSDIVSTWSGDSPSDKARLEIKIFLQKKISSDWQIRGGLSSFYQVSDYTLGAGPFGEFRYNEWLMFGVSAYYLFPGIVGGPSVRVEMGNYFRQKRQQQILEGIWAVDENGNPKGENHSKKEKEESCFFCN